MSIEKLRPSFTFTEDRLKELQAVVPEAFADGKINWDMLREARLLDDDQVVFYFKFPPSFKIQMPRLIGNYNPDWGIARYNQDGKIVLELVRETKGSEELATLQFPSEKRKITCVRKHFKTIGIDYRVITDKAVEWWKSEDEAPYQERLEL
jgi:restriction endonuclease